MSGTSHGTSHVTRAAEEARSGDAAPRIGGGARAHAHTVLVVDDNRGVLDALRLLFKHEGWRVIELNDPDHVVDTLGHELVDLVLLDMNFSRDTTSGAEGVALLARLRDLDPELPVILMTAWGTVERAVEGMKLGARDYQLGVENALLREELDRRYDFSRIVGRSPAMVELLRLCADVAPTEATVLVTGPPGTGKELIAHAIYANSARRDKPFVKVHVGALHEGLFEGELFGHVKGAFTDARDDRPGRFAIADGGTLFLDEIGTIAPAQQVKLLRVLQEGEFEPIGSTRTRRVDVRVIAATNADLAAEIAAGRFREDLYYRLNVVELRLPALRERPEDIPLLASRFLEFFAVKNRKHVQGFSDEALSLLGSYEWPGNVRELENVIERAVILARADVIGARELPLRAHAHAHSDPLGHGVKGAAPGNVESLGDLTLEELEKAMIERALREHRGNVSRAASVLGLSRAALYRRIEKYKLG
jgi:DNA-binding NtrC family response regulator